MTTANPTSFAATSEPDARATVPHARLLLGLELLLAAVLGVIALGTRSFWLDESTSFTIGQLPWHGFTHIVGTREGNMVLYHLLLSWWMGIGDSEFAVRSLSVIFSVLAVLAIYLLARRLGGERVALIAGLLLAVNPVSIRYAQETRGYELSLLLVTASSAAFVRALARQTWGAWVAYAVLAALGVYAHFFALLVPAAHALSLVWLPPDRLRWRKLIGAAAMILVGLLPFFYLLAKDDSSGVDWVAGNPIGRIFTRIHEHPPVAVLVLAVSAAILAILFIALRRWLGPRFRSEETWRWALLLCWLLVPPAVMAVVAIAVRPLFVAYYFIVCLPAVLLLLALLIDRLRVRALAVAVGAVVLLTLGSVAADAHWYRTGQVENWRGATQYVVEASRPGDGVLFYPPYVRIPYAIYLDQQSSAVRARAPKPVYPAGSFSAGEIQYDYYIPMPTQLIRAHARGFDRIWLVSSHVVINGQQDPGYAAVVQGLRQAGFRADQRLQFTGITVVRYDATSS